MSSFKKFPYGTPHFLLQTPALSLDPNLSKLNPVYHNLFL